MASSMNRAVRGEREALAEVERLRAHLAKVEAERDARHELAGQAAVEVLNLRARLAEVEAELDQALNDCHHVPALAEAEARLAAVLALCDAGEARHRGGISIAEVLAAAQGEGDRGGNADIEPRKP